MRILIAGYYNVFWHEEAWVVALRELGHEVIEFRINSYINQTLIDKLQNRFVIGPLIKRINHDFIKCVNNCLPDVILCYKALLIKPDTISALKKDGRFKLISYNNDNIFAALKNKAYWRLFRECIPYYDIHLVYRKEELIRYQVHQNILVYELKSHFLPWLHQKIHSVQKSDVCFLGHCENDRRIDQLDQLMKKVPAVYNIHGALWKEYGKFRSWYNMDTHELQGDEYVRGINESKIALCFFSTLNADDYTRRVFEIPACGTLLLSQRSQVMQELYEEDKEAVYFGCTEELIDKVGYYLKHDQQRNCIANAGKVRCLSSGYDIYSRMQEWINLVNNI